MQTRGRVLIPYFVAEAESDALSQRLRIQRFPRNAGNTPELGQGFVFGLLFTLRGGGRLHDVSPSLSLG